MEVLEFLDTTGNTMVKRVPDSGDYEIKWGAQLTVRESQNAIFFRDGRALDSFGPGRHVLQTQNIPLLTKLITRLGYGTKSPFRSEVYFLNMPITFRGFQCLLKVCISRNVSGCCLLMTLSGTIEEAQPLPLGPYYFPASFLGLVVNPFV